MESSLPSGENLLRWGRRRSPRIPLEAVVHYQLDGSEFINLSSNLSGHGIFVRNFMPPPVGTPLCIKVNLPAEYGGIPVQLQGKVARVAQGFGLLDRGMGVQIESMEADSQPAMERLLSDLDAAGEWTMGTRTQNSGEESFLFVPIRPEARGAHPAAAPRAERARWLFWVWSLLVVLGGLSLWTWSMGE